MAYATYKSVEVATLRSSLTPCIFDDDPCERETLTTVVSDMGYEPLPTGDPEEALRLIRLGRCRLVLASSTSDSPEPYDFLIARSVATPACTSWS